MCMYIIAGKMVNRCTIVCVCVYLLYSGLNLSLFWVEYFSAGFAHIHTAKTSIYTSVVTILHLKYASYNASVSLVQEFHIISCRREPQTNASSHKTALNANMLQIYAARTV